MSEDADGGSGAGQAPCPPAAELARALADERARAERRLAALTAEVEAIVAASEQANLDDEHDPEGATVGFERAQAIALRDEARTRLVELDAAEARLAAGTIDVCASCGGRIGSARLLARPTARRCVRCAAG